MRIVHDAARGATVAFRIGRRGDTTLAATEHPARNWRSLQRESGAWPFALRLGCREMDYGYDHHPPRRLLALRG